jgi:hypothetical protein
VVTLSRQLLSLLPVPAEGSRREPGRQPDRGTGLRGALAFTGFPGGPE